MAVDALFGLGQPGKVRGAARAAEIAKKVGADNERDHDTITPGMPSDRSDDEVKEETHEESNSDTGTDTKSDEGRTQGEDDLDGGESDIEVVDDAAESPSTPVPSELKSPQEQPVSLESLQKLVHAQAAALKVCPISCSDAMFCTH